MSYLLDTCILSKLQKIKKYPDFILQNWIESYPRSLFFVSVITIAEIQAGISKLNEENAEARKKKINLENWLYNELIPGFQGRILEFDLKVALKWGSFVGRHKKNGINIPLMDSLIAATALQYNLVIVTENSTDFDFSDVLSINPWKT